MDMGREMGMGCLEVLIYLFLTTYIFVQYVYTYIKTCPMISYMYKF